jgi:polyisoprenoid-binding protein YceI
MVQPIPYSPGPRLQPPAFASGHSLIEFSVKHMMFTTVRGRFKSFEGTIQINEEHPEASYVEGTVDVASIDTTEPQRDNHLRSADFFDVEKYPTMSFRSTRIEPVGDHRFKVCGELTIKDVTREVVFDVTEEGQGQDPWGNQRRGFSANTRLSRKDFGLNWNVALETGGWLVSDDVNVSAEVQVVQEQPEAVQGQLEQEAVAV